MELQRLPLRIPSVDSGTVETLGLLHGVIGVLGVACSETPREGVHEGKMLNGCACSFVLAARNSPCVETDVKDSPFVRRKVPNAVHVVQPVAATSGA